jgi:iron complex outermembrane receptor protein
MPPACRACPVLSSVLLLVAAPAFAQVAPAEATPVEPAAADPVTLDTVQVLATRSARPAHEAPASVSVVEGDDLDPATADPGLSSRLRAVPGVLARNRHNLAQDEQLSIRGFGTRASFGIRGVRLYVDGIPATMPDGQGQVSHFPLAAAARIEVLRGPFSALYGNAAGGVIALETRDGADDPGVGIGLAADDNTGWRADLSARGGDARFDYALALGRYATGGVREHGRARRDSFNAKLNLALGDGRLTLLANALDAPDAQDPQGLTREQFEADPRQASAGALAFDTRKSTAQRQAGAVYELERGAHRWRVLGYAGERQVEQFLSIPVATQASPLSAGGVIDLRAPHAGVDARWTWATTLAGWPLELVAGLAYDRLRQDRHGYENFVGNCDVACTLGVRGTLRLQQDDRVRAFDQYAQATWDPHPDWSLSAGLRHADIRFESRDRYVTDGNPDDSGTLAYRNTSPVFGVLWRAHPALNLHAAHGRGFETPTFNELGYRADGGSGPNFALRPARTRSSEVGLKLGAGRARGEVALFHADTRDELAVDTSAGGRTTYRNLGRATRDGAEWSLDLALDDAWRLQVALAWLDARYREAFLACAGPPCRVPHIPVAAGARIPGVPRTTAFVAMQWNAGNGWHGQLDGQHVGAVPVNVFGDEAAAAYAVFGASAGYRWRSTRGDVRAWFGVANLADREHAGSVIVNEGNRRYYEPAPRRTFTAGLELRWRP